MLKLNKICLSGRHVPRRNCHAYIWGGFVRHVYPIKDYYERQGDFWFKFAWHLPLEGNIFRTFLKFDGMMLTLDS